jgi:predicted SprT family Zn-dependent metalloprotease
MMDSDPVEVIQVQDSQDSISSAVLELIAHDAALQNHGDNIRIAHITPMLQNATSAPANVSDSIEWIDAEDCTVQVQSRRLALLDEALEALDPTPDVRALFLHFDTLFFDGTLQSSAVAVTWSKRMTLCAGICSYEGDGGLCSIRLSEPLLQLRPRSDTVNTLLHEMIHAYLFVTKADRDRDGHGPDFQWHMNRINNTAATTITVYHTFHAEVDAQRKHIWKCDGPCQSKPPYYGIVKRAMNRAPGPSDWWFAGHTATCGGTYHKIQEPTAAIPSTSESAAPGKAAVPDDQSILRFFARSGDASLPHNQSTPALAGVKRSREESEGTQKRAPSAPLTSPCVVLDDSD